MDEEKLDFTVDDEYEKLGSFEYQLDNMKILNIGCIEHDAEVFGYMSIYRNYPDYAFSCSKVEDPTYIERYDVFEVKLNNNSDLIQGFEILGCDKKDIEYAELYVKIQEKKPRSLIRFNSEDIVQNGITPFVKKYWEYLPCSFLKNRPEYFLEIQLKDESIILVNDLVRVQVNYIFMSNQVRKQIESSEDVSIGNRRMKIEDKLLKLQ